MMNFLSHKLLALYKSYMNLGHISNHLTKIHYIKFYDQSYKCVEDNVYFQNTVTDVYL